jgi:hypothetical protein
VSRRARRIARSARPGPAAAVGRDFPANRENISEYFKFPPLPAPFRRCLRRFPLQFHGVATDSLLAGSRESFRPISELIHRSKEITAIGIIVRCPFHGSAAAGFRNRISILDL